VPDADGLGVLGGPSTRTGTPSGEHAKVADRDKESPPRSGHSYPHQAQAIAPPTLPEVVYTNTLPWWRAALRRRCVAIVEWEGEIIAQWQARPSRQLLAV